MSGFKFAVKVVPGASKSEIVGWLGTALKIRLVAPPQKGQANKSLVTLLAKTFDIDKRCVSITSGLTSTHKTIEINGLKESSLIQQFRQPPPR